MIAQRGLVLMESFHARLLSTVSQTALRGAVAMQHFQAFDHRRLSADMAVANWHTKTGLK